MFLGTTVHTISSLNQAASAAIWSDDFTGFGHTEHSFHFVRAGAHDTQSPHAPASETIEQNPIHAMLEQSHSGCRTDSLMWDKWEGTVALPNTSVMAT